MPVRYSGLLLALTLKRPPHLAALRLLCLLGLPLRAALAKALAQHACHDKCHRKTGDGEKQSSKVRIHGSEVYAFVERLDAARVTRFNRQSPP